MSSRSLGLLAGFLLSQGRSSPASWRLMSSGSSVRKRMRPCKRTLSGRFSILRSRSELITDLFYRWNRGKGSGKNTPPTAPAEPGPASRKSLNHKGHKGSRRDFPVTFVFLVVNALLPLEALDPDQPSGDRVCGHTLRPLEWPRSTGFPWAPADMWHRV